MKRLWFALLCLAGSAFSQNEPISISGTVLGTNGVPLRKANVVLQPIQGVTRPGIAPPQRSAATSDSGGRFAFNDVTPGHYSLTADHIGYLQGSYGAKGSRSSAVLNVTAGQDMTDITIRLTEQSVITGKVVDEDGDPVNNAQVRLLRKSYLNGQRQLTPVGFGRVDDIGEFRISAVAAGQYYLNAEPQRVPAARTPAPRGKQEEQAVLTYYPSVTDVQSAVPVRIGAGETLAGMNIRLVKAGVFHIRGSVVGLAGNLSQSRVTLTPRGSVADVGSPAMGVNLTKDGTFDIAGVAAGSWNLAVFRPQGPAQIVGSRLIEVRGQDVDDLVLNAQPPQDAHGVVRFETGDAPHPGLRVTLIAMDSSVRNLPNVQVGGDGAFTLPGSAPGKYRVSVIGLTPETYLKAIQVGGRDVLASGFEVNEGGGAANMEILIGAPAAEVFGVVLGADGNNAPGSVVTLVPDPFNGELAHLFQRVSTDQSGKFSLRGVAPGSYRVYAWEELEPGAQFDPDLIKAHDVKGVAVTVSEGDRTLITLPEMTQ